MLILETERLRLRTMEPEDAAFYLELVNDPTWIAGIGDKGLHTVEAARAAILDGPCAMQRERGHSLYVVERRADGALLGLCGLIKRDALPDVDIGYALRPAYWGQGYAQEAGAAVLGLARDGLKLPRVLAITKPSNTVSGRLLEKLGLSCTGTISMPPDGRETRLYRIDFP
ncbi:GNAT family N-acetyltransferase [Oxalobacteraceae bacterium A2-2]